MSERKIHFNLFLFTSGHHSAAWRHPNSALERLGDIEYYQELAKISERGLLDAVFFADGHSVPPVAQGARWFLEPLTTLSAIAAVTEKIGLISTVSSTFYTPFHAARFMASLDHISKGRIGVNVVTSMWDAEARNHNREAMPASAERYARAEEFIQVITALWDSWADDAIIGDRDGNWADPDKVRPINHHGKHFLVDGPLTVPRTPQGRPVLIQAGASEDGRNLAAQWAEAIYAVAFDLTAGQDYYRDVKRRIAAWGRSPDATAILPGLVTYIGSTEAEARAKKAEMDALLPVEHSLRELGLFIGQDCSDWDVDAPIPELPDLDEVTVPKGRYSTILRMIEVDTVDGQRPLVRQVLGRLAAGGGHCTMIGTPEQVANEIEKWFRNEGADGFNLMPPMLPNSLEDFIDQVIPILQQRGLFRTEYEGSTLRSHFGLEKPVVV